MKVVDLREVRKHLPLGSIVKISEKLNISPGSVSQVFRGRYPKYKNAVLEIAFEIINAIQESEKGVTEKAVSLGFMTSEFTGPYQHKKKKVIERKVRFEKLYTMDDEQLKVYLEKVGSKIVRDDFSGMFISDETTHLRFIKAICEEQGLKIPVRDDLERMNHGGLIKAVDDLKLEKIDVNDYPDDPDGNNDLRDDIANILQLPASNE